MRFYLSVIIILLTLSVGMFLGGIKFGVVFNISEWLLISGIAVGSFIMSNPISVLKRLFKQLGKIVGERPYNKSDYLELLVFMFNFFKYSNSVNASELEPQIDDPHSSGVFNKYPILLRNKKALSFFQDHFRVTIFGFQDVHEIDNMMEIDINTRRECDLILVKSLNRLGDSLPALGIIAAVLGVIGAMSSAGESPEILGARVAAALIGTFAGVFIAYCIVNPIATFLDKFQDEEIIFIECIKIAMISFMKGYPASIAIEFARQAIPQDLQPSFYEIEEILYDTK